MASTEECSAPGTSNSDRSSFVMYLALKDLCQNNEEYFKMDISENGQRLHEAFFGLQSHIETVMPLIAEIQKVAPLYDFDENTPGNGYRSFLKVVDGCIDHSIKVSKSVCLNRDSILFRKGFYMKEIEACNHLLASLASCLKHLQTLLTWSHVGDLFPKDNHTAEELFAQTEAINQYCFYGRCLGFQFCDSMRNIIKGISICMAGFSEAYYSNGNLFSRTTSSVWTGGKYYLDPELRARRIVNISQLANVDFCKSFWFLAESQFMHTLPSIICHKVEVNKEISIPPQVMFMQKENTDELVEIPIPCSHGGPRPISVRLLSSKRREGMIANGRQKYIPACDRLLIHCHGGGFVAQSSKSHELYLREWAQKLDVPILSIDYSLAPEAPFPRALEEVFYAYCWALQNSQLLGSTGKNVVLAGDSAGANLNLGLTLKCIETGIRKPSGLFVAYVPVLVSFVPSPARMLCLMDPLLPFGFMMRCLKAYACPTPASGKKIDLISSPQSCPDLTSQYNMSPVSESVVGPVSESDLLELEAHRSYVSDATDTLTNVSLSSSHDLDTPVNEFDLNMSSTTANGFGIINQNGVSNKKKDSRRESLDNCCAENKNAPKVGHSEKYVSEFLDKYVLVDNAGSEQHPGRILFDSEENVLYTIPRRVSTGLQDRISNAAKFLLGTVSSTFYNMMNSQKIRRSCSDPLIRSNLDALIVRSPSDEFMFHVPRDPYLSPYWADDSLLKQLPPIRVMSIDLDPCLDDGVMFAKKLKSLGNNVGLDILKGLPHGFLNFAMISKDAHEGSLLCIDRIRDLFAISSSSEVDKKLIINTAN